MMYGPMEEEQVRTTAISCRNIWKVFGASDAEFSQSGGAEMESEALAARGWTAAVRDATFDIGTGEVFVIMGLSGSGKSTIVRCLSRLIEPTQGQIMVEGSDLLAVTPAELNEIRRRKMGMVFQHFALLPNRDVLGNIGFPLQVQGVPRAKAEARAREMVELVGLAGREDHFPDELSGGQQQRVGIARSLASDPAIWFLDEPFSALDPLIRSDLQDELLRLQSQLAKTVIFITHDLDEAIKIADRIAIMEAGRIVQIGTPEELILTPANDYVARFTRGVPRAKVVRAATIMRAVQAGEGEPGAFVGPDDRIADVAEVLMQSDSLIGVRDRAGRLKGVIDREAFIRVLAGA